MFDIPMPALLMPFCILRPPIHFLVESHALLAPSLIDDQTPPFFSFDLSLALLLVSIARPRESTLIGAPSAATATGLLFVFLGAKLPAVANCMSRQIVYDGALFTNGDQPG